MQKFSKKSQSKQTPTRQGDWICYNCNNLNFSFRINCNRCKTQTRQQNRTYENYLKVTTVEMNHYMLQKVADFNNISTGINTEVPYKQQSIYYGQGYRINQDLSFCSGYQQSGKWNFLYQSDDDQDQTSQMSEFSEQKDQLDSDIEQMVSKLII